MDEFKRKTFSDYDKYDINCKFICQHQSSRKNNIKMAKRKARRKLKMQDKQELLERK